MSRSRRGVKEQVLHTIECHRLLRPLAGTPATAGAPHVLVACSGGGDSIGLVLALHEARHRCPMQLTVASVDHGLRAEARDEVAFVGTFAASLGLGFEPLRVDLGAGGNLHDRARRLRYRALQECAQRVGATFVATGHTLDDQAETVLSRALRGGRVSALRGVAFRRRDGVVRPLLEIRREELRGWLRSRGVAWIEDPSNEDLRFERARIRDLWSTLEQIDPRAKDHLAALAADAADATRARRARGRRWLVRVETGSGLSRVRLKRLSGGTRREVLRQWLRRQIGQEPSDDRLIAVDHLVCTGAGEVRTSDAAAVCVVEGRVCVQAVGPPKPPPV